jgi:hypothetical protein
MSSISGRSREEEAWLALRAQINSLDFTSKPYVDNAIYQATRFKEDTTDVNSKLALKADTSSISEALALKADTSAISLLAKKSDFYVRLSAPINVSASSTFAGGYDVYNAIDGNINNSNWSTGWHSGTLSSYDVQGFGQTVSTVVDGINVYGEHLTFDFGTGFFKVFSKIKIYLYDLSPSLIGHQRLHQRFVLAGSNNLTTWTNVYNSFDVLGKHIEYTSGSTTENIDELLISNKTVYRYYRYIITKMPTRDYAVLNEIRFFIDDESLAKTIGNTESTANYALTTLASKADTSVINTTFASKADKSVVDLLSFQIANLAKPVQVIKVYDYTTNPYEIVFPIPYGVKSMVAELVGGGGSGASYATGGNTGGGTGGGAGAYIRTTINVDGLDGNTMKLNVGYGAIQENTVTSKGFQGGQTSIQFHVGGTLNSLVAKGGMGGHVTYIVNTIPIRSAPGGYGGTTEIVNPSSRLTYLAVDGGDGCSSTYGMSDKAWAGTATGGASYFGSGGAGAGWIEDPFANPQSARNGKAYGSGGGSGMEHSGYIKGGVGAPGCIILTWIG